MGAHRLVLDGASAAVNYATEKARVFYPAALSTDDVISTVEKAGYAARAIESPHTRCAGTGGVQPASTTEVGSSTGAGVTGSVAGSTAEAELSLGAARQPLLTQR